MDQTKAKNNDFCCFNRSLLLFTVRQNSNTLITTSSRFNVYDFCNILKIKSKLCKYAVKYFKCYTIKAIIQFYYKTIFH